MTDYQDPIINWERDLKEKFAKDFVYGIINSEKMEVFNYFLDMFKDIAYYPLLERYTILTDYTKDLEDLVKDNKIRFKKKRI